jgi:hypothetical protein
MMGMGGLDTSRTHTSLLIRVRDSGDTQAWDEFHERYAPMIRGWCRRWFPHETDDMVQEVFLKLVPLEQVIRAGLGADTDRWPTLKGFVATLRGKLNQLIADTLTMPPSPAASQSTTEPAPGAAMSPPLVSTEEAPPARPALVALRVVVSRQVGPGRFRAVATTHPRPAPVTRDMRKVPPVPGQARVRTGERVRVEVVADRDGYLAVFNVGPTGHLNLLHPADPAQLAAPRPIAAHRPLHVLDVELTPPAGRERVFAVWTRRPLPLRIEQLPSLVEGGDQPASRPYRATRDMKRVQQSLEGLDRQDRHALVLELDHVG